jgi:hypothetical protein
MVLFKQNTLSHFVNNPQLLREYLDTYVTTRSMLITYLCDRRIVNPKVLHQLMFMNGFMVSSASIVLFMSGDEINEEVIDEVRNFTLLWTVKELEQQKEKN